MVDNRSSICRSPELYTLKSFLVGLGHSSDPIAVRVLGVTIQGKLVGHLQEICVGLN